MSLAVFLAAIFGLAAGFALAALFYSFQIKSSRQKLRAAEDALVREQITNEKIQGGFRTVASDVFKGFEERILSTANREMRQVKTEADSSLENTKNLIGHQFTDIKAELEKVSGLVSAIEKDREKKFGELSSHLKNAGEQTAALLQTTQTLNEALANSRARGQWGQRMAEDVLRLAGFAENINYLMEKTIEGIGSRPDITFLLPKNLKLNMDVKFPYDNYMRFLESDQESDRERFKGAFFKDVKAKLKEITSRDYINPQQNTVDYVILFVPNEQIFNFIHAEDSSIIDEGLQKKVILCSPITLFAVLAVIRQAVDNFSLEQTSKEILSIMGTFKAQWDKFSQTLERMGKRIDDARDEYDALVTTRKNQLERPLNRMDSLRQQKGIPVSTEDPIFEISNEEEKPS